MVCNENSPEANISNFRACTCCIAICNPAWPELDCTAARHHVMIALRTYGKGIKTRAAWFRRKLQLSAIICRCIALSLPPCHPTSERVADSEMTGGAEMRLHTVLAQRRYPKRSTFCLSNILLAWGRKNFSSGVSGLSDVGWCHQSPSVH